MTKKELIDAIAASSKLTKADAGRKLDETIEKPRSAKAMLAFVAAQWNLLTDAEMQSWNDCAVGFPAKNRYGDLYTPSGYQVFMKLNANLTLINLPILRSGPVPNFPVLPPVEPPCCDPPELLRFGFPGGIPEDQTIMFYACPPVLLGSGFRKGKERLMGVKGGHQIPVVDVTYQYQNLYGAVKPGASMYFRLVPISNITGQAGVEQVIRVDKPVFAKVPRVGGYIDTINIENGPTGLDWVIPFRFYGFNIPGNTTVSTPVMAGGEFQIGRTLTGPWVNSIEVTPNELLQPSTNVLYLKFAPGADGLFTSKIKIAAAGATDGQINIVANASAIALAALPDPLAFGDSYRGINKVLYSTFNGNGLRHAVNFSFSGAAASKFLISENEVGPWTNALQIEPDSNGLLVDKRIYIKYLPTALGADAANLNFNCSGDLIDALPITGTSVTGTLTSDFSPGYSVGNNAIGVALYPDFAFDGAGLTAPAIVSPDNLVNCTVQFSELITGPWVSSISVPNVAGSINTKQIFMKVIPTAAGAFSWDALIESTAVADLTLNFDGVGV